MDVEFSEAELSPRVRGESSMEYTPNMLGVRSEDILGITSGFISNRFWDLESALKVLANFNFIELTNRKNIYKVYAKNNLYYVMQSHINCNISECLTSIISYNLKNLTVLLKDLFAKKFIQRRIQYLPFSTEIHSQYVKGQLGSGSFSNVFKYEPPNEKFALKVASSVNGDYARATIREISALITLVHPNIIRLLDVIEHVNFKNEDNTVLVLPLAEGSLARFKIPEEQLDLVIYQLCRGLAYIHMYDIWHRDIKPQNILRYTCGDFLGVMFADFGLARSTVCSQIDEDFTNEVYTLWYRSPEILLGNKYSEKSDVWALGVTIYEIITGENLFRASSSTELISLIFKLFGTPNRVSWPEVFANGIVDLSVYPIYLSTWDTRRDKLGFAFDLVSRMLQLNPDNRPKMSDLLYDPYFARKELIDDNPCFWAPKILPLTCEEKLYQIEPSKIESINLNEDLRNKTLEKLLVFSNALGYNTKTFFLAVDYFDNYFSFNTVENIDLINISALNLAAKLNEYQIAPFEIYSAMIQIPVKNLSIAQDILLRYLKGDLNLSTSYDFYQVYKGIYSKSVKALAKKFLFSLILTSAQFLFNASQLALISIYLACRYRKSKFYQIAKLKDPNNSFYIAVKSLSEDPKNLSVVQILLKS